MFTSLISLDNSGHTIKWVPFIAKNYPREVECNNLSQLSEERAG